MNMSHSVSALVFSSVALALPARAAFGPLFCPVTNDSYRCVYTARVSEAPVRGGFMLPADGGTRQDFADMAAMGAHVVRYHMNIGSDAEIRDKNDLPPEQYEEILFKWLETKLAKLDEMISWEEGKDILFAVGLHGSPGGLYSKGNLPIEHMDCLRSDRMFNEKAYAKMFVRVWQVIAARYKGEKRIYGYDLVIEPNQTAPSKVDFWNIQRICAEEIRKIDPETPIIVESNKHSIPYTYDDMAPIELPNILYSVHMYLPFDFTHQGVVPLEPVKGPMPYPNAALGWDRNKLIRELDLARKFQLKHGAKMFVGEYGAAVWAPGRGHWLYDVTGLYNDWGWDWCYHAFREWTGWSMEHTAKAWGDKSAANFVSAKDTDARQAILIRLRELNARAHR